MNSLKCSWIKRYCNESVGNWKLFFDLYLKPFGNSFIFQCNYHSKDVQAINNVFIRQVLEAWSETVFTTPVENFGSQIIWNNFFVRIDNNIVMYKNLFGAKNVMYVSDLFDQDNLPLPFEHFKYAFGIDSFPFTLYHGLINAIPQTWRRSHCVGTMSLNGTIEFFNKVCQSTSASQVIYSRLINRFSKAPTSRIKWQSHFNTLTDNDWRRFFRMPYLTVSEAKLRYFQFKFLHRIIATNKLLYLMKKNDSDLCSFFGTAVETLEHLFWECNFTASFILDVEARALKNSFAFLKEMSFSVIAIDQVTLITF